MAVFRRLLVNTLVTGVTSSFLWFALTFWVYLETRSVVATGVIGGAFSISSAVLGPFFGTFVDRHRKHAAMVLSTAVSALCFAVATVRVRRRRRRRPAPPPQPLVLAARRVHAARLGGRPDARHRPVDLRHPARARRRAGTGPTAWSARSPASPSPSPRCSAAWSSAGSAWAGPTTARWPSPSSPSSTSARSTSTSPSRPDTGPADGPKHVDVRGALDAIRAVPGLMLLILLGRLQQPAGRRVHGPDGRLRPVAGVGRDVGLPVGLHQPGVHRRRPVRRPLRPRPQPAAASSSPATSSTGRCARSSPCGRRS